MIVLFSSHPIVRVGDLMWDIQEDIWAPAPPLSPDVPTWKAVFHPLPPAAGEGEGILVKVYGGEALRLKANGEVAWWRVVYWPTAADLSRWAGPLDPSGWMTPEGDLLLPGLWLSPDGEVQRARIADRPVHGVGSGRSIVLGRRQVRQLPGGGWQVSPLRHTPKNAVAYALHLGPAGEVWAEANKKTAPWEIRGVSARGGQEWSLPQQVLHVRALADGRWVGVSGLDQMRVFWGTPEGPLGEAEVCPEREPGEIGPLRPLPGGGWLLPTGNGMIVGGRHQAMWRPLPLGWPNGTIPLPGGLLVPGWRTWWALPSGGLGGDAALARVRSGRVKEIQTAGDRALIVWEEFRHPRPRGWIQARHTRIRYTRWPSGEDLPPTTLGSDVASYGFWALWRGRGGEIWAGRVGDRGQPQIAFQMPPGRWEALRALPDGTALAIGRGEGGQAIVLRLGPEAPQGTPLELPGEIQPKAVATAACEAGLGGVWVRPTGMQSLALLAAPDGSVHLAWGLLRIR